MWRLRGDGGWWRVRIVGQVRGGRVHGGQGQAQGQSRTVASRNSAQLRWTEQPAWAMRATSVERCAAMLPCSPRAPGPAASRQPPTTPRLTFAALLFSSSTHNMQKVSYNIPSSPHNDDNKEFCNSNAQASQLGRMRITLYTTIFLIQNTALISMPAHSANIC